MALVLGVGGFLNSCLHTSEELICRNLIIEFPQGEFTVFRLNISVINQVTEGSK